MDKAWASGLGAGREEDGIFAIRHLSTRFESEVKTQDGAARHHRAAEIQGKSSPIPS